MLLLDDVVDRLAEFYGEPVPPQRRSLLDLVVFENDAYLVDDERRARAFDALQEAVGTRPEQILAAPDEVLIAAAAHGILAGHQADKLRRIAVLGLDSHGVRALTRLGIVHEAKSYATTYRAVQAVAAKYQPRGIEWLLRAHQLLRQHGQELCRRTRPQCDRCPLSEGCAFFRLTANRK